MKGDLFDKQIIFQMGRPCSRGSMSRFLRSGQICDHLRMELDGIGPISHETLN